MIGRVLCWFKRGHIRGKFLREEGGKRIFACPRCKRETSYRAKA